MRLAILLLSSALLSQVAARELGTRGARRGIRRLGLETTPGFMTSTVNEAQTAKFIQDK